MSKLAAQNTTNHNLALWESLEKTDPAHTKQFSRGGGFKGTSINGAYILKRLTEAFGPCGKGWNFVLDDEQIVVGHTLKNGDKTQLHIVRGHLKYLDNGIWCETSPQFGQTMLVDENKYGTFTDEEAPKKSITDCLAKCAVMIGIGADIHLGLFDDNKYVNQRKREESENDNQADDAPLPTPPKQSNGATHNTEAVTTKPADTGNTERQSNPRVQKAADWCHEAISLVGEFETATGISAWLNRSERARKAASDLAPVAYKALEKEIIKRQSLLKTQQAAE